MILVLTPLKARIARAAESNQQLAGSAQYLGGEFRPCTKQGIYGSLTLRVFQIDGVSQYIDWAIENKFGVMDINIRHYITRPDDIDSYIERADERAIQAQVQELMCYIWDNYLQIYDGVDEIFLMGVGNAYLGVKVLLINRNVKARVAGVINFVDSNPLRPVKSDTDEQLSSWYKDNSLVYVAGNHACWANPDLTRKVMKRRFGTVFRSPVNGLTRMMNDHAKDAQQWILERCEGTDGEEEDQSMS